MRDNVPYCSEAPLESRSLEWCPELLKTTASNTEAVLDEPNEYTALSSDTPILRLSVNDISTISDFHRLSLLTSNNPPTISRSAPEDNRPTAEMSSQGNARERHTGSLRFFPASAALQQNGAILSSRVPIRKSSSASRTSQVLVPSAPARMEVEQEHAEQGAQTEDPSAPWHVKINTGTDLLRTVVEDKAFGASGMLGRQGCKGAACLHEYEQDSAGDADGQSAVTQAITPGEGESLSGQKSSTMCTARHDAGLTRQSPSENSLLQNRTSQNQLQLFEEDVDCLPVHSTAAIADLPPLVCRSNAAGRVRDLRLHLDGSFCGLSSSTDVGSTNGPLAIGGCPRASGGHVTQTPEGGLVRYENVMRTDGQTVIHLKVGDRFAIGSRGLYHHAITFSSSKSSSRSSCNSTSRSTETASHMTGDRQGQREARARGGNSEERRAGGGTGAYPPVNSLLDEAGDNLLELGYLGRGAGSVEVIKALHIPSMRMVAVKKVPIDDQAKLSQAVHELEQLVSNQVTIRERIADDSTRVDPMRDERRSAQRAALSKEYCPFIISLYDAYKFQGQLRLVMEYMNGGSLQDLVDKGGSSDEALLAKIAYNILRGLHYLHTQGKIHRDIKPGNCLINSKNFVKIADFGLAASLDRVKPQTVGTNRFLPPELLESPPDTMEDISTGRVSRQRWSTKGDIWSFGLSLWAVAQGSRPYDYVEDEEVLLAAAVIDDAHPEVDPALFSPDFRDFIDRCLAKDPAQRYSAEALLQHPFVRSKAYVYLNEKELENVVAEIRRYFRTHPTKAVLTQAMARALAEEIHLDERHVTERLREGLSGVQYVDATATSPVYESPTVPFTHIPAAWQHYRLGEPAVRRKSRGADLIRQWRRRRHRFSVNWASKRRASTEHKGDFTVGHCRMKQDSKQLSRRRQSCAIM